MSWKFFLRLGWSEHRVVPSHQHGHACSAGTAGIVLQPCGSNYWTAPLMLLAMWGWSKSAPTRRGPMPSVRLRVLAWPLRLAFLVATILKLWIDFPRPPAVLATWCALSGHRTTLQPAQRACHLCRAGGRRALAFDRPSWPHRLGVVRRIGRLVTHRSRNALSADVLAGGT